MSLAGLRLTRRAVVAAAVGILPAALATLHDAALAWAVGWDLLLALAVLADALLVPRRATTERRGPARVGLGEELEIALSSDVRGRLLDEPPEGWPPAPELASDAARYSIRAPRRGDAVFGAVNLIAEGPLGLVARRIASRPAGLSQIRVIPGLGALDRALLDPRLAMAELGIKPVRRRAEGTEIDALRDANPEDDPRRLDWRATARRGRLTARSYRVEQNHELLLCLDTGRLMGAAHDQGHTKLDLAIVAALRLAAIALASGDRVGLLAFDRAPSAWVAPDRGRAQLARLVEAVYALEPGPSDASFVRALAELRRRQAKRALVVFLSDFADPDPAGVMSEAVAQLARRHLVLFVALRDPELSELADAPVRSPADAYRAIAGLGAASARRHLIAALRAHGVEAIDAIPGELGAASIRAYLGLRAAGRI